MAAMDEMVAALGWTLLVIAAVGVLYTVAAGLSVSWFFSRPSRVAPHFPPVTILKPLHGDEPYLRSCLEGFCTQDYPAPVQLVFGVRDAADPAVDIVKALARDHSDLDIKLVVDGRTYGANLKISNLINMERVARHPVVVLADSDVSIGGDYLRRLVGALSGPNIGFATCAFVGVPTGNLWSSLSAMAINYHFLPSVAFGLRLGLAKPCFGPTIAFRKATLDEAGGFVRFADHLADDFEIGRAIRGLGYDFAAPPFVVGHGCPERSGRSLWTHELRWARTIQIIDPLSHAGSAICHPLPWALLAAVLLHGSPIALATLALTVAARLFVTMQVDRVADGIGGALWLTPARDLLSALIWGGAFLVQTVSWRGRRFTIRSDGILVPLHRPTGVRGASPQGARLRSSGMAKTVPSPPA